MLKNFDSFVHGICVIPLLVFPSVLCAADPTTQPQAAVITSQPAPLDPQVEKILDRLEEKGRIKDLQADIEYVKEDAVLDSKQVYKGILLFKEEQPNPRFFIRFDQSTNDAIVNEKKEWHVFDGQWYIEARQSTTTINKRQVVRPGEKAEVFGVGKAFPLPFGQKKADIVRHFDVKLVSPKKDDLKNTDHLECKPLPGTDMARKYDTVHFFIDRDLGLPVKLSTVDKDEDQQISATFKNLKVNTEFAGSELNLPSLPDYRINEERLPEESASGNGK